MFGMARLRSIVRCLDMTYIVDLELKYYKMNGVEGFYVNKVA